MPALLCVLVVIVRFRLCTLRVLVAVLVLIRLAGHSSLLCMQQNLAAQAISLAMCMSFACVRVIQYG